MYTFSNRWQLIFFRRGIGKADGEWFKNGAVTLYSLHLVQQRLL